MESEEKDQWEPRLTSHQYQGISSVLIFSLHFMITNGFIQHIHSSIIIEIQTSFFNITIGSIIQVF